MHRKCSQSVTGLFMTDKGLFSYVLTNWIRSCLLKPLTRRKVLYCQSKFWCIKHTGMQSISHTTHEWQLWLIRINDLSLEIAAWCTETWIDNTFNHPCKIHVKIQRNKYWVLQSKLPFKSSHSCLGKVNEKIKWLLNGSFRKCLWCSFFIFSI